MVHCNVRSPNVNYCSRRGGLPMSVSFLMHGTSEILFVVDSNWTGRSHDRHVKHRSTRNL